ncbi:MAG: purine-nucleoside phosphorylase [Deltaproteobacteria bacterium]|nr:purine-nucleoside phosphorylase [Deltaproteobacteria bacterium]
METPSFVANWNERLKQAVDFLKKEIGTPPSVHVILSGGLTQFLDALTDTRTLDTAQIPNFPLSRAEGHKGQIVFGKYKEVPLSVSVGRVHYYEGYSLQEATFPIHALHVFGAKTLLVVNAAGGINPGFAPGDLMLIRDHINFLGDNPLRGVAIQSKQQFVDMTGAYSKALMQHAYEVAKQQQIELHEGVYVATTGPSYETPAEIRAFRQMGADAAGMSTVPEVIVASFHRMSVLGVSCITNLAADLHPGGMHHGEVLKAIQAMEPRLVALLLGVIERTTKTGSGSAQAANS